MPAFGQHTPGLKWSGYVLKRLFAFSIATENLIEMLLLCEVLTLLFMHMKNTSVQPCLENVRKILLVLEFF